MIPLNVLVVDDRQDHCEVHRAALELDSHRVTTEQDPLRALELLRQQEYHMVLLDLQMPGVHGLDLLAQIRHQDNDVAVVIVTADASIRSANAAIDHDIVGYLTKPVNIESFREMAERVIRKKGLDPHGEDEMNQAIGRNLRALRRQHELTLKQLARRTALSASLLSQMERGESSTTVTSLFKVAAALGVSITSLFDGYTGPGRPARRSEPDREARSAAVPDREARSAADPDREARSAADPDREARSAAVPDREARSAAVPDPLLGTG